MNSQRSPFVGNHTWAVNTTEEFDGRIRAVQFGAWDSNSPFTAGSYGVIFFRTLTIVLLLLAIAHLFNGFIGRALGFAICGALSGCCFLLRCAPKERTRR